MKLGVIMGPIDAIKIAKDTTFELMLTGQRMGWEINYIDPNEMYAEPGEVYARSKYIEVKDEDHEHYQIKGDKVEPLTEMDAILMRVDPPVTMDYISLCQLLDTPERRGVMVVNSPRALRTLNEKLTALTFYDLMPPTLVTNSRAKLQEFLDFNSDIVVKPLYGMGGSGIFRVTKNDSNVNVILETMTASGQLLMAQLFLPEVVDGDRRVLVVHGEVVPYTLARIPGKEEFRGNLAVGGKGVVMPIQRHEEAIALKVARWLTRRGVALAGLDIIGNYLTEINITSPTCMREIERETGFGTAQIFFEKLRTLSDKKREDYKARTQSVGTRRHKKSG